MSTFLRPVSHTLKQVRAFSVSASRSNLNKVQLIGRVGSDPIVNETSESRRVANYTVATSEVRADKEGSLVKSTQWHRITYWQPAEWFSKIKKGDQVYVEGKLRYSDYTDKEGVTRTKAEIHQTSVKLLSLSRNNQQEEE
ncbi:Single-stranded DNA-binding protein, mitochondrial [Choanephora cucurbitarum]|uniref:Single-stranded DNA-binding protein n=1 Tax=Choanephora cucurbitarum TaxID=101091 RepID=A0A1C7NQN3_9FUNG|nr:Single-stranded DNA-binding protein, mitochondrial [Choanephora cucurbitarum]